MLPFLCGDRIGARVDLKADRQAGVLRVQSAWTEPGAPAKAAERLAEELRLMAGWLGLQGVSVSARGDLGAVLAAQIET